jgi:hypothetical protein
MAKGPKFSTAISPVGIAKVAFLHNPSKPFEGNGDPHYKTRALMEDTEENRAFCTGVIDTALAEAKANSIKIKKQFHNPFTFPEDVDEDDFIPDEGKERPKYDEDYRGKIFFEAKSYFPPSLIDSARQSLAEDVKVYNMDEIRVKIEAAPFVSGANTGITLRLKTVQLIKKNAVFSRGPDIDGFDDIEGYTGNDTSGDTNGNEDF